MKGTLVLYSNARNLCCICQCFPHVLLTAATIRTDLDCRFKNWHHFYPDLGLQLGVSGFFPLIKITVIRQVRMSLGSTVQSEHEDKQEGFTVACLFAFVFGCRVGMDLNTPNGAPWLTNPLQGMV